MKITIIHGQSHEGSTCHVARLLAEKLNGEVTEFFLPRDFDSFCVGCTACFGRSETLCPHYEKLAPLTRAMDEADVIILASPVYVFRATGAMKAFLDHYGYRWMVHRPEEKMFGKQAVCISTAAGMGMRGANRDMAVSAFFWGVARTYKYGVAVAEVSWDNVSDKIKQKIEIKTLRLALKIRKRCGKARPGIATKTLFYVMRMMQRRGGLNETDVSYWLEKGWLEKNRPWKKKR